MHCMCPAVKGKLADVWVHASSFFLYSDLGRCRCWGAAQDFHQAAGGATRGSTWKPSFPQNVVAGSICLHVAVSTASRHCQSRGHLLLRDTINTSACFWTQRRAKAGFWINIGSHLQAQYWQNKKKTTHTKKRERKKKKRKKDFISIFSCKVHPTQPKLHPD